MRIMAAGGMANMLVFILIIILVAPIGHPSSAGSDAHIVETLPNEIWRGKYAIIRDVYGRHPQSFKDLGAVEPPAGDS